MPDAVVAVIQLNDKKVGILYFAKIYQTQLEDAIKDSSDLGEFKTIDFLGYHTKTLPKQIREGNLEGLVCKSTTNVELDSEQYKLYIYKAPLDIIYREIIKIKQNSKD